MKRITVVGLLVALVAGCGDDGDETRTGEPATASAEPTTATTTPTTTTSPATTTTTEDPDGPAETAEDAARTVLTVDGTPQQACRTNVTTAFISISYGSRKNCLAAHTPHALAESIEIRSSKKTAIGVHLLVVPDGGPYDGAKVEVEVIGVRDAYFVDSLQAHVPAGP